MVGFTLESGWINVGKWLDLRWKMVGLTLENGWINVGKWLDLRWKMVGSRRCIDVGKPTSKKLSNPTKIQR